ncbi:acyltransferase [Paenibacillus sp. L3-i20]|uniref:acyltransferase n=1 Tax=Paenibacillus sp. L3-i20 TaxID=2905833 RepID=UPI001EDEBCA7|nr:acyltransferase family protein [Paenibacillus sp. L3-i20]GKU76384.1 hypothetical protein L3i20_v207810 [Paenibacillus sp. L3-i20]
MKQHLTTLRIAATFAVVMLHISAGLLFSFEKNGLEYWWYGNIVDSFTRWSVPIFFMISGALLLNKVEEAGYFYRKRLKKIAIPFLFWSLFYLILQYIVHNMSLSTLMKKAVDAPYYHLWFLFAILGLYLVTPLLQRWMQVTPKGMLFLFIVFWIFNSAIIPLFTRFTDLDIRFRVPLAIEYIGYFVMGHYLEKYKPKLTAWLFPIGLVITIFGTYYLTAMNDGMFDRFFYGYFTLNVLLMSVGIFVFFQKHPIKIPFQAFLDKYSFGVFLVHALILTLLNQKLHINATFVHPVVGIVVTMSITLPISYLIIWAISKVPYLKRII